MKKTIRYFGALAAVAFAFTLALAGCTTDNETATYTAEKGVAFNAPYYLVDASTTGSSFKLPLNRLNASESLTVDISVGDDFTEALAAIFTVPSTATFVPGQYTTDITIAYDPSGMALGQSYNFAVRSSNPAVSMMTEEKRENSWDPVTYLPYTQTEVRCAIPLVWNDWARCAMTLSDFWSGYEDEITMQKAEGANRFRLVSPITAGYHFVFNWDIDNRAVTISPLGDALTLGGVPVIRQHTGEAYTPEPNAHIYWLTDPAEASTKYDPATKTLSIRSYLYVFNAEGKGLGGWDWFSDTYRITEFLDGDPWQ